MFFSTSTPQTLWDAFAPFTHFTRSNMAAYCSGCFFAVNSGEEKWYTYLVNDKNSGRQES